MGEQLDQRRAGRDACVYLEEVVSKQTCVGFKRPCYGLGPSYLDPEPSNLPYRLCDRGKLLNLSKLVSLSK